MSIVFSSGITSLTERNTSFDSGILRVCYTGKNRNNSFISKETFERCMPSIYNCPIVCRYDRDTDTIGSHDMELVGTDDGGMRIVNITQPVGVVPESAKYWWEEIEDDSGLHEYLCVDVLIWKRQEAYKKIKEDGITDESMEISVKEGGANAVMVSWSFLGHKWTGENSGLLNTVLRDEWGFRGMALTDFFRNNGHGFMNADAALANGVDAMLSTFDGEENNVADPSHPTSVLQMRGACKNVMYTVVSSWAYDGDNVNVSMEGWKKAAIAVDAVLALGLLALEIVIIKGYQKRKKEM